jgi:hypothetical protein
MTKVFPSVFNNEPCAVTCNVERYDTAYGSVLYVTPTAYQQVNGQMLSIESLTKPDREDLISRINLNQDPVVIDQGDQQEQEQPT